MNKNAIYKQLEEQLVKYRDLINVDVNENEDDFVTLDQKQPADFGVVGRYETLSDMKKNFPLVPVRREVKDRLDKVDMVLKKINKNLQLVVAYGYRNLEIQQKYFDEQKKAYLEKETLVQQEDIDELIHRVIAVPTVAGHPTGGAVDVFIEDNRDGTRLDFGAPLFTFDSKDVYSFSPFVSNEAKQNRQLLRKVLMSQDFAPYDGEWWHFSFGDKEWAFYYKKPYAIYEQKPKKIVFECVGQQ